jgi:Predicted membrane protein
MNRRLKRLTLASLAVLLGFAISGASAQGGASKDAADFAIVIKKKDISSTATFIPYKVNGIAMEILAVKASDGSIRTALNTCQVCYRSGRGYYKQVGDVFVCQNCGNRFKVDQIEKIKGGCNPVPILGGDKADLGDSIGISKAYLESVAPYFAVWKKRA